jgi:hypothetical protein
MVDDGKEEGTRVRMQCPRCGEHLHRVRLPLHYRWLRVFGVNIRAYTCRCPSRVQLKMSRRDT